MDEAGAEAVPLRRERLPARLDITPTRMLKTRPTSTTHTTPRTLAQHIGRCVGAPSNDERHKRHGCPVITGVAAQP
jgi:hypothetical protein